MLPIDSGIYNHALAFSKSNHNSNYHSPEIVKNNVYNDYNNKCKISDNDNNVIKDFVYVIPTSPQLVDFIF